MVDGLDDEMSKVCGDFKISFPDVARYFALPLSDFIAFQTTTNNIDHKNARRETLKRLLSTLLSATNPYCGLSS